MKIGGVGLNLTSANVVILSEPWWNPAVDNQAIDRINRIG
jgi:SNF2 family DNA or RNA helicase